MKVIVNQGAWRLLGALIGLGLGGGLAVLLGDAMAKALNISNFEGGRGYFVLLVLIPLFALTGAVLGAIMIYLTWRWNVGILLVLTAVASVFVLRNRDQFIAPPPQVETLGNFELLTYVSEEMGEHYGLRYRGEPFTITGRAGLSGSETATYDWINAVITFTLPISLPSPAFVVNVGDPNNQSFFYLVREVDGQAKVEHLSDTHSNIAADWLDVAPSDPTAARDLTVHRGRLEGGRWLLLGDNCVLDVQTLTAYPFDTYPLGDGVEASLNQFKLPLGLAPDQRSFVRLGSSDVRDGGTNEFRGTVARLIVFDFRDRTSYTLPVDRLLLRYPALETIDSAWLAHHFVWQPTQNGPERLVQRTDFAPLPYQGQLTNEGQEQQYNLAPVKPELFDKMVGFLEQKFKAVRLETKRYESSVYIDLKIGEQLVNVGYSSDGYSDPRLSVWLEWQAGQDGKLIEAIAQHFDDLLKTGAYDGLFLGDPVALAAPPPTAAAPTIAGVEKFSDLSQEHTSEPLQ